MTCTGAAADAVGVAADSDGVAAAAAAARILHAACNYRGWGARNAFAPATDSAWTKTRKNQGASHMHHRTRLPLTRRRLQVPNARAAGAARGREEDRVCKLHGDCQGECVACVSGVSV